MKTQNIPALGIVLAFILLGTALGLYWYANRYEYTRIGEVGIPVRINRFTQNTEMWLPGRGWQSHR